MKLDDTSNSLLTSLLEAILRAYGWKRVVRELERLGIQSTGESVHDLEELQRLNLRKPRPRRTKLAVDRVETLAVDEERKQILVRIAERFDRKNFLPAVSDIREFLAMRGERRPTLRDRSDGFGVVLSVLEKMPIDRLQDLATSNTFSGPAALAPLSDAIRETGQARRENSSTSTSSQGTEVSNGSTDKERGS